jgi:hypothetical protein
MSKPIMILLSILVCAVTLFAHLMREKIGLQVGPLYLGCLALFLVISLWIFPEPKKKQLPRA